jgi:phosphate uptake regulator
VEFRKVQKTGGSTYIVSLPKKWVTRAGIEAGMPLAMIEKDDGTLLITRESRRTKYENTTINARKGESPEWLFKRLVAKYIVGYEGITVVLAEDSQRIPLKKLVKNAISGVEVEEELKNIIKFVSFYERPGISIPKLISRINLLLTSMFIDLVQALSSKDKKLYKEVGERDDEIDRLYYLGYRLLTMAIRDRVYSEQLQVKAPWRCLGFAGALRDLEQIGDHITKIPLEIPFESVTAADLSDLKKIFEKYKTTMRSFIKETDPSSGKILQLSSAKPIYKHLRAINNRLEDLIDVYLDTKET